MGVVFGMAHDLYRRSKYVVYSSYGPPIGNHVIDCGARLPYIYRERGGVHMQRGNLENWTIFMIVICLSSVCFVLNTF